MRRRMESHVKRDRPAFISYECERIEEIHHALLLRTKSVLLPHSAQRRRRRLCGPHAVVLPHGEDLIPRVKR
jgi:hypothetical protein